jgi:phage gpG-like protein
MSKIKGISGVLKNFKIYSKALRSDLTLEVFKSVTKIELKAKQVVPVDLGKLKQSIYHKMNYQKSIGEVGATEFYAPFIEFGTGTNVQIPSGYEDFAMTFYVNGKGTLRPRPFLIPSFLEGKKELTDNTQKIVEKYSGLKSIKRL